jgi:hypothetical protein
MELLVLQFSPTSCYFILRRSKYSHNLKNWRCENLKTYIKMSSYLKINWPQSTNEITSLDSHAAILHLPTIYFHEIIT